ncbi:MAG: ATP-binding protein [Thermodesulfobacteriota bacterium]|nr:ATP-binding protein [Thermodesulfobacteriota bacterium]
MKELIVISGKGGTGKTSILAALASLGPKKVLADCDVDAADLHLILHPEILETFEFISGKEASIDPDLCVGCGICAEHCVFEAISPDFQVIPEHCEGCGVCAFMCPEGAASMSPCSCGFWYKSQTRFGPLVHATLKMGEENSGKMVSTVREAARSLAEEKGVDLVLVDGSPGIGCPVIASLSNIDLAVLVAEPTISAVHDLKRVFELTQHFKIPALVLVNKVDINPELVKEIHAYCRENDIPVLGEIPYDQKFTQAQIAGQAITEFDPQGLGKDMERIWEKIEKHLEDVAVKTKS